MVQDALAGKIDLIITKSVSRFARNTVDTLTTIRLLKEHGVEVYFEEQNIYSLDSKGELLLTIMSSLAQEESRNISENVTWGMRKRFADGKVALPYKQFLGYKKGADGIPEIVPEEAATIKLIYRLFMEGKSPAYIARFLSSCNIPSPAGRPQWRPETVKSILSNEKYKGDALLQKSFTVDFLTKTMKPNRGELPSYYVKESHPPIISADEFDMVQAEIERRSRQGRGYSGNSIFSSKLFCGDCGSPMFAMSRRDLSAAYTCGTYHRRGRSGCSSHHIRVDKLDELLKIYVRRVMEHSHAMLEELNAELARQDSDVVETEQSADHLAQVMEELREELKATKRQRIRDILKHPEQEELLAETYDETEAELQTKIEGLDHQIQMLSDRRNTIIQANRTAKTAMDVFRDILDKQTLERNDLELIIQRIDVFEDRLEIHLCADIDTLLHMDAAEEAVNFNSGTENSENTLVQSSKNHEDQCYQ